MVMTGIDPSLWFLSENIRLQIQFPDSTFICKSSLGDSIPDEQRVSPQSLAVNKVFARAPEGSAVSSGCRPLLRQSWLPGLDSNQD
jgi:hypothetical protein